MTKQEQYQYDVLPSGLKADVTLIETSFPNYPMWKKVELAIKGTKWTEEQIKNTFHLVQTKLYE